MIRLRAHHLLCLSRFNENSSGYDGDFEKNFTGIFKTILENPDVEIIVKRECDNVCEKCPHIKDGMCNKPSKYKISHWIRVQDNKTMRLIKIKPNSIHKARDIFKLVADKIGNEELKKICKGCEYLDNCVRDSFNKSLIQRISEAK
ncbi:MAG: DUF1284 domain-containing protein [Candidatus Nanoarchaeia archaeon]|nr:DUF1284 domain-containing protein [Candidatus Nanoarchaeia archaeon]